MLLEGLQQQATDCAIEVCLWEVDFEMRFDRVEGVSLVDLVKR